MTANDPYAELEKRFARLSAVNRACAILNWDRSTMMPDGASEDRADQLATLNVVAHEIMVAPDMPELLGRAEEGGKNLDPWRAANLREMRHAWVHANALPADLVEARTRDLSQANQSLQESEMRFRATFDHAPVGILQASVKERRILHVNRKLCEMLGYTPNELLCMTTSNLLHRGYDFTESGDLRDSMPGSEAGTQASECVYVRRDGGTLWVNRTISLVRDTVGNPLYFILVAEDITERWRSAQMQAQLAAIVETSNDAIVGRAPDDRIIS